MNERKSNLIIDDGTLHPACQQIRLGLCCINNTLRKKGIFCSRTTTRKNFTVERAQTLALQNISDISKLVEWNYRNNIYSLRLSSDMFPHFTDNETQKYSLDFAIPALQIAGEKCIENLQRITMHPGQYNQIAAKNQEVLDKTHEDLKMHCDILDHMGIPKNSGIVNIHGGGVYGDKESTMRRWIEQFDDLPSHVKQRLTIENCEKCYSARDCLTIATECKIPVVFDTHHYDCYSLLHPNEHQESPEELIPEILDTWGSSIPLFHISEQRANSRIGAHSDYIEKIPQYLIDIPEKYGRLIDIDVEAKAKEAAILQLYKTYPDIFMY
jgi:UV DNA damage endonuclease